MKIIAHPSTQAQLRATECKKIAPVQCNFNPPPPMLVAPLWLSANSQKRLIALCAWVIITSVNERSSPIIEAAEQGFPITDK